jgi:hypothetical protein
MKTKSLTALVAIVLLATMTQPARAWVAAGGYHGGCAVAYHPPCCYSSGASVAGAAVAGMVVGAAIASSAKPPPPPPPPVYVPVPVYYAAPVAYAPAVGTVVASLPGACTSINISGVSYMNCAGVFYLPYYSGGALLYQVVNP